MARNAGFGKLISYKMSFWGTVYYILENLWVRVAFLLSKYKSLRGKKKKKRISDVEDILYSQYNLPVLGAYFEFEHYTQGQ